MTVGKWLKKASDSLNYSGIKSAYLDSLIILEDVLGTNREYLLSHQENNITTKDLKQLNYRLSKRKKRIPLAYIRGFCNFYNHSFFVNNKVMVPRPESEAFIEYLIELEPKTNQSLIDVGTGSGILAISSKFAFPYLSVSACDISSAALQVAQKNARELGVKNINYFKSDLLFNSHSKYDYIQANLPYVPLNYPVSAEIFYEPQQAIFAKNDGLYLIEKLFGSADEHLNDNGYLFIESLPEQHNKIINIGKKHDFKYLSNKGLVQLYQK